MNVSTEAAATLVAAREADLPEVVDLMNRAYRGTGDAAGWTTEASYIGDQRTCLALLRDEMAANVAGVLLLWRTGDVLLGCVWLEPEDAVTWYLGSLTIDPSRQAAGLGRALLTAAEDVVRARGGREIKMSVVAIREELIAWYVRRGYSLTSETAPFPYDDPRYGTPLRQDLEFVVLRKELACGL